MNLILCQIMLYSCNVFHLCLLLSFIYLLSHVQYYIFLLYYINDFLLYRLLYPFSVSPISSLYIYSFVVLLCYIINLNVFYQLFLAHCIVYCSKLWAFWLVSPAIFTLTKFWQKLKSALCFCQNFDLLSIIYLYRSVISDSVFVYDGFYIENFYTYKIIYKIFFTILILLD